MKKLVYISFIFAFLLAFTSCNKERIEPNNAKCVFGECGTKGPNDDGDMLESSGERGGDGETGGGIVDPDEDEDFDSDDDDGIVDPDEDEDFDEEEDGK